MRLKEWEELPDFMKSKEVKEYYDILIIKRKSIFLKRAFDFFIAILLLIIAALPMIIISVSIAIESRGGILFRQYRVTSYGKVFRIHKFRTMVTNAEKMGASVTTSEDQRITKIGHFLRKYRLDELPQLLDVIAGNMSFVGTRPEIPKYVDLYSKEMYATLLLPAGITSEASIRFKDEAILLDNAENVDKVYMEEVLPEKMKYNLESIRNFSFGAEIVTMIRTVFAVLGVEYR